MTDEEKDKLHSALLEIAHELDQLQDYPMGFVRDKIAPMISFLVEPTNITSE